MSNNSIRTNLNKESIISSIKLELGADLENKTLFLVVEVEDDWKFLKKFLTKNVAIYESFSGKEGVREIVSSDIIRGNRVFGIRDRDYLTHDLHERIFYYDYSCLEIMILSNINKFENIYNEYYLGNIPVEALRTKILNDLLPLSLLRKSNEENTYGIKFKGLSIENLLNDHLSIKKDVLIQTVIDRSPNANTCIETLINNTYGFLDQTYEMEELFMLTQGHDFITLFKIYCNKEVKRQYNDKDIASSMRCSFVKYDFTKTQLYNRIVNSEVVDGKRIFAV